VVEVSVWDDNLRPFLTALGWLADYGFDADDWEAVSHGVRNTDAEAGVWFEYELCGRERVPFSVAFDDAGSSIVMVRAAVPAALEAQAWLLGRFCREFHWRSS
jgi:hypothetical protein